MKEWIVLVGDRVAYRTNRLAGAFAFAQVTHGTIFVQSRHQLPCSLPFGQPDLVVDGSQIVENAAELASSGDPKSVALSN